MQENKSNRKNYPHNQLENGRSTQERWKAPKWSQRSQA